jgi:predicted GIY-YIG superfamily endonuclease
MEATRAKVPQASRRPDRYDQDMVAQRYPPLNARGTVYLLHFSERTKQNRQHYLGWTSDLARRFAEHRSGRGCRETRKPVAEGLTLTVAQTWAGTPLLERRLKEWSRRRQEGFAGICPLCGGTVALPHDLQQDLGTGSMRVLRLGVRGRD